MFFVAVNIYYLADPRGGGARDACSFSRSDFFHFHAVFSKNWPNNSLVPTPLELEPRSWEILDLPLAPFFILKGIFPFQMNFYLANDCVRNYWETNFIFAWLLTLRIWDVSSSKSNFASRCSLNHASIGYRNVNIFFTYHHFVYSFICIYRKIS